MLKPINKIIRGVDRKTESPIEDILLDAFSEFGVVPVAQFPVPPFRLDFAFPEIKLAIEADGHAYHSTKSQKERDAYRQKRLEEQGWKVERFSGSFIHRNSDLIVSKICLKYFKEKLTEEQEKKAVSGLVRYFTKNGEHHDLGLAEKITNSYLSKNQL